MQLVQEGRIKLIDKITNHLTYYRKDTGDRITIHHLLAHQSGIKDFTANFDFRGKISPGFPRRRTTSSKIIAAEICYTIRTIYSYCNAGYIILGRIIEKVTRKTFERNVQERIFEPLG